MKDNANIKKNSFSTFEGVFTPSILTIIGVIMYLRLGWVIGQTGFLGAIVIILLAHIATVTTGLAMSSMTTNVNIGDGGFYSLISRSLGLEIGGAIGTALYLSQSFSASLYIVGFTEAWIDIFPSHNGQAVSLILLSILLIVAYFSAKAAMKVQYLIMAVIGLSIVSIFMGTPDTANEAMGIMGKGLKSTGFWYAFAIFFPAVTGISAGASMSGELKDAKKSIPQGVMSAIGLGFLIYLAITIFIVLNCSRDSLVNDNMVLLKLAKWKIFVLCGVMGATVSSAIGSIVGAPRVLMALGQDKVLPFSKYWKRKGKNGEPRIALIFTAFIVVASIVLGDLNTIAPLLTMFFLITYGMINIAVFIEQAAGITSFRPSFKIPKFISLIGGLWCFIVMFLINFYFALASIVIIVIFYIIQIKRGLQAPWGDVRISAFNSLAEWAAKTAANLPYSPKNWKPNLVIPIEEPSEWQKYIPLIRDIVVPSGTLRVFSITRKKEFIEDKEQLSQNEEDKLKDKVYIDLESVIQPLKKEGIFTSAISLESKTFIEAISITTQVMRGMYFPPNIIFATLSRDSRKHSTLRKILSFASRENLGQLILAVPQNFEGFVNKKKANLWLRDKSPNAQLSLLVGVELEKEWGFLTMVRVSPNNKSLKYDSDDMDKIIKESRLPLRTEKAILLGDFWENISYAPKADLNIFGVSGKLDFDFMNKIVDKIGTPCLFTSDSGQEDAKS